MLVWFMVFVVGWCWAVGFDSAVVCCVCAIAVFRVMGSCDEVLLLFACNCGCDFVGVVLLLMCS